MAEELLPLLEEARDLLLERRHGNSTRSPGHNARLVIEAAIALFDKPSSPPIVGDRERIDAICNNAWNRILAFECSCKYDQEDRDRWQAVIADFRQIAILASLPAQGGEPVAWRERIGRGAIVHWWEAEWPERTFICQDEGSLPDDFFNAAEKYGYEVYSLTHPVPEQSGWRFDMENAPKDGTRIDIWDASIGERIADAYWSGGQKRGGWWAANQDYGGADGLWSPPGPHLTAWMPLPAPPQPEQEAV